MVEKHGRFVVRLNMQRQRLFSTKAMTSLLITGLWEFLCLSFSREGNSCKCNYHHHVTCQKVWAIIVKHLHGYQFLIRSVVLSWFCCLIQSFRHSGIYLCLPLVLLPSRLLVIAKFSCLFLLKMCLTNLDYLCLISLTTL